MTLVRPTRAEVDLGAVVANARVLRGRAGDAGLIAVIKADAYGHGAILVARALVAKAPILGLAVSLVEEALELRAAGIAAPILVLGGVYTRAYVDVLAAGVTPVLSDPADVEGFADAASRLRTRARVHVKVDTGMARLGVRPAGLPALLDRLARRQEIEVIGLCTHLSSADAADEAPTKEQLRRFAGARAAAGERGLTPLLHVANTAATLRFPAARFGAVRPGLGLFGGGAPAEPELLRPAMRLVSAVAQLRTVPAGDSASYGGLWRAPARSRLATLPVGYADGYPRRLTGSGEVLVCGRRCPVVGAICMDMTIIDVTALGERVAVGDEAVLLGAQGEERVTAAELATRAGVIEYEILCGISKRVPRRIVREASPS